MNPHCQWNVVQANGVSVIMCGVFYHTWKRLQVKLESIIMGVKYIGLIIDHLHHFVFIMFLDNNGFFRNT